MNQLPLWPPFVALAVGMVIYGLGVWETRKFDKKYPDRAPRKD